MKYLHLVWAALFRRKTRTFFTIASVLAAFLLFGLLDSVRTAFAQASESVAGANRILTMSRISFTMSLPQSLLARIQAVPGVKEVAYANWFGGVYQDPKNFFANEAVSENFFSVYSDFVVPPEQLAAFRNTRTGAIVGEALAQKYGWKIGDKIPLQATIFPQKDGSNAWTFDLVGIYRVADPKEKNNEQAMFFNWKYFDEARQFGNGAIGWYIEKVDDPANADRIANAIDAISANSDHETKTQSENAFTRSFVSQFADIGLIVAGIMSAVFFTLILLTGNTMAQAVRERIPELAILKTLGFSNPGVLALVLAESVLLVLLGGLAGIALAAVVVPAMSVHASGLLPDNVRPNTWALGIGLMLAIGLVVGVLPALRGMHLKIVDALAGR
ncbi:MAG: ABC transporter permease [Dokdonella sp.]|uniref:ABC transporter permease n=1 Tax=Dokdonella sp. TaxID=2291710 RepID=UPI0025C44826|nr:FtsX-like permease family protein [Dokdonella sp.]MBZ0221881.1 ABC transporter permease [Dokdonella sp.]